MDEEKEKEIRELIDKANRFFTKRDYLIAYDAGLEDYNSNQFKTTLTQMLIDEGVNNLQSTNKSTILFSISDEKKLCFYWTKLIEEAFKNDKNYNKHLFFTVAEIRNMFPSEAPIVSGKQDTTLNTNYIEQVKELRSPKK
jgi:hypothetical protein